MEEFLKILVADDSLSYRMTIMELLEDNNYAVQLAENGKIALDMITQDPPDLVVMDIIMPEMDGTELCIKLKSNEKTEHIPVIMLTSMDDSEEKIYGLNIGADEYLTKPFNHEELLAKINSLLRIKVLQGQLGQSAFSRQSMVLVADDSLTVRMELSELLEEGGYRTIVASDGEEALQMIHHYLPDMAILDVIMPGMDGIEVCRQIKNNHATQQIPVVIITSKTDMDEKIRGLNAGADDYLFKPYHPKEFTAKVAAIFRTKKMQFEMERNVLARKNQELQTINQKLKDTQAQLIQNEKMVALGQLVAGIAHEINNPLAFVISNSKIFKQTLDDYQNLLDAYKAAKSLIPQSTVLNTINELDTSIDFEFLKENVPPLFIDIEEGLERIRKIVLSLRNFSRLDEAERKRVDLIEGIESTLNLINHQIRNRIEVIKELNPIPQIECYPSQLNQVFMNILVNSIQAIKESGKITIRTEKKAEDVLISFEDTGEGIPPQVLEHIFEPFFTTKKTGQGTGLGLSISYGIIEKHKGKITYTSEKGNGTKCTIRLPIH